MHIRNQTERGDTIVEVLICILVISTMLAGAFATTNNSLQAVRMSQERSQAIKITESQVESLRAIGPAGFTPFCIAGTTYHNASTATNCYFNQGGQLIASDLGSQTPSANNLYANAATGPQFNARITMQPSGRYEIKVEWVSVRGQLSTITMYYRLP